MLSVTINFSSGKCQLYHSFMRIANVLMSLSSWSIRAIDWIIGLSARLTSWATLFLENAWAKPSYAFERSLCSIPLISFRKCNLMPLKISSVTSFFSHFSFGKNSDMLDGRRASSTANFALRSFGMLVYMNSAAVSVNWPVEISAMFSKAWAAVTKARWPTNLIVFLNLLDSRIDYCTCLSLIPKSSLSFLRNK